MGVRHDQHGAPPAPRSPPPPTHQSLLPLRCWRLEQAWAVCTQFVWLHTPLPPHLPLPACTAQPAGTRTPPCRTCRVRRIKNGCCCAPRLPCRRSTSASALLLPPCPPLLLLQVQQRQRVGKLRKAEAARGQREAAPRRRRSRGGGGGCVGGCHPPAAGRLAGKDRQRLVPPRLFHLTRVACTGWGGTT